MSNQITTKQLVAAYHRNGCNQKDAAEELGIPLSQFRSLARTRPGMSEMMAEVEEARIDHALDIAETMLINMASLGDFKAIELLLKTKGRKRGYGNKLEISREEGDRKFSEVKIIDGQKIIELK